MDDFVEASMLVGYGVVDAMLPFFPTPPFLDFLSVGSSSESVELLPLAARSPRCWISGSFFLFFPTDEEHFIVGISINILALVDLPGGAFFLFGDELCRHLLSNCEFASFVLLDACAFFQLGFIPLSYRFILQYTEVIQREINKKTK